MEEFDYLCKIVFVGDSGVGKSSLIKRFIDDTYIPNMTTTIGVDFAIKSLDISGKSCKLQIWDTGGQEKFRAVTTSFYRGANGVVVCFDPTSPQSFESLPLWFRDIRQFSPDRVPVILVATKCDLEPKVSQETSREFARLMGVQLIETSSKVGTNVAEAFVLMAQDACSHVSTLTPMSRGSVVPLPAKPVHKEWCQC
eukprot:c8088_g1_i2.p1 GENE.c8088_g1_i2~~c8088_g1_i2.p1  ORF type:complete len:197 (+),score=30.40 c8088_g1_i2:69-659(+)